LFNIELIRGDFVFKVLEGMVKSIINMFPVETETLDDFVDLVEENKNPIEIQPVCQIETSQNTSVDNIQFSPMITGRRCFVRLVSTTKEGKEIIHDIFCGFISALSNEPDEEKNLLEKTYSEAKTILSTISSRLPNIPAKIVQV